MLPLLAIPLIFFLVCLVVCLRLSPETAFFAKDQGLTSAVTQTMLSGEIPLLGPPSHIGGRHLGPLHYWYNGFLLSLSGGDEFHALLIDVFVKLCSAALLIFVGSAYAQKSARAWTAVGISLAMGLGQVIFMYRDAWQPHLLLPTGVLFWWAVLRFLEKRTQHIMWVLVAGSLCIQVQYAAAILAAPTIVGLLLVRGTSALDLKRSLTPCFSLYLAGLALFLVWLPSLLYELWYPSNLRALFQALIHPLGAGAQAGFGNSLRNSIAFFSQYALGAPPLTVKSLVSSWQFWIALFGTLPCLAALLGTKRTPVRFLICQTLIGGLIYTVILSRQPAPLERYFLLSLVPPLIMIWGLLFGVSVTSLIQSMAQGAGELGKIRRVLAVTGWISSATLLVFLSFQSYDRSIKNLMRRPLDPSLSLSAARYFGTLLADDPRQKTLLTWGSAKLMDYSYLYFAGPRYWSAMSQGRELKELTVFESVPKESKLGFLIACPIPSRERRKQLAERLAPQWTISKWTVCSPAYRCGQCASAELEVSKKEAASLVSAPRQ